MASKSPEEVEHNPNPEPEQTLPEPIPIQEPTSPTHQQPQPQPQLQSTSYLQPPPKPEQQAQASQEPQGQGQSQYTEQETPVQVTISSFTQFFKTHKPVLFVCYQKLKEDLQFRYDKLFEKLKVFVLREKRPYRMFITIQNFEVDFQTLVDEMEIMQLPIGTYLIFQSNFNDKGGITIEKYKNCFILKANMKKNSEFQNGYCRFGALEVYEILFSPQTLEKEENIVFDNNKELIRAAKWKGYRTFYLSDESLMDGLTEWTNLFSMEDLVFKSDDLSPLSNKIFTDMEKLSNKSFESKWKLKDTMNRSWIATADIVGYMIEPDQINFSSQLVKIINNMYNSMLIKTMNIQLAKLEPSVTFKFPKTVKQKLLLHYLIEESDEFMPITSVETPMQEILKTGVVVVQGKQYELEGLGGIILVASLFYMNQEIEKIYSSIYIKLNPEVEGTMQAYIRDLRVVFNALKEINVKSEYFFDLEGKRKFSVLEINQLRFFDMHIRIKTQIIQKLNVLKNYLELKEHHQIFNDADDKKLKYFEISKKAVFHNLSKRINNLVECYEGLEVIPEGDILHQIELILKPHMSFQGLCQKIMDEKILIITAQFSTDINLLIYYLQKSMTGKYKYVKVLNFADQPEAKVKKMLSDCKKSLDQIIFIINYDSQIFTTPLYIYNMIINSKGERSTLVAGCAKRSFPLKEVEMIAAKHVKIDVVEVMGTKITQELDEPQFNLQSYDILEEVLGKFVPSHKDKFMEMGRSPQFMEFMKTPSILHQLIQVSRSIEKKNIINLGLLFKLLKEHWELYINQEYGRSIGNSVKETLDILTAQYFTNRKRTPFKSENIYDSILKIQTKQRERKYKKGFQYQTLSFLLFEHGTISFKHEMFAAYLAAENIINNELDNTNSDFNCIKYFVSNSMVRLFLQEKLIIMNMRPKLLATVKESKYRAQIQTNLTNCGIAASLLALLQPDLSGLDFAFCQFPDATFQGCNLSRTDFSYSNMLNCYFGRANCYQTLIFRCKHIGSVQFQEVVDHQSINQIKQIVLHNKTAYVLVNGFLEKWQYPFNKCLSAFQKISLNKICMRGEYLFGATLDTVYIIDTETLGVIVELRSKLLVVYNIIVSDQLLILTSNTNCMEQWKWKGYIEAAMKNRQQMYTEKVLYKYTKIFYAMKRVCCITLGEHPFYYIGDAEGNIFKYDIITLNIISNHRLLKEGEILCLGFFEGERSKRLLSFSEDLYLKMFTIDENKFQEIWSYKQFQYLRQISMNEDLIFAMSGHALSVYGKKNIGKPISKLNYYRQDGLNFTSMFQEEKSKTMVISHMKGILSVPFLSKDMNRESFGHQYSITCLIRTKTSIVTEKETKEIDIIISGGLDMKLNFWSMESLEILASVDVGCTVSQLTVDRTYLLVASQFFYILIYSLENFELVGKLTDFYQGAVNCMRIYDQMLFTGSGDRLLIKYRSLDWKYRSKMVLSEAPTYIVCGVDYIECIVGTEYGKILWIDDRNFVKYQMSEHKTSIESIIIDNNIGFSCSSDILLKWEVRTREILANIIIPASIFTTMNFYKEYIMATIGNSIMFLSRDLKELLRYPVHGGKIRTVIYDEENQKIYSAGDDRCIKKFTVGKGYDRMDFQMSVPKRLACNRIKFN